MDHNTAVLRNIGDSLFKKFAQCLEERDKSEPELLDFVAAEAIAIALLEAKVDVDAIIAGSVPEEVASKIFRRSEYLSRRFVDVIVRQQHIAETRKIVKELESSSNREEVVRVQMRRIVSVFEDMKWLHALLRTDDELCVFVDEIIASAKKAIAKMERVTAERN